MRQAESLATQAIALDPLDPQCHFAIALVHRMQGRFDQAVSEFEAAIQLNPNLRDARAHLGLTKLLLGRGEEALPNLEDSIRLSPRDPLLYLGYLGIGVARFLLGDDDGAIQALRKSISSNSHYSASHMFLAAALWDARAHGGGEEGAGRLLPERRAQDDRIRARIQAVDKSKLPGTAQEAL